MVSFGKAAPRVFLFATRFHETRRHQKASDGELIKRGCGGDLFFFFLLLNGLWRGRCLDGFLGANHVFFFFPNSSKLWGLSPDRLRGGPGQP